jgi:hypothetical protein
LLDRLRSRELYQDFLKCLNLFSQDIIAKQELQFMVQDILGRYPDLMVRCRPQVRLGMLLLGTQVLQTEDRLQPSWALE